MTNIYNISDDPRDSFSKYIMKKFLDFTESDKKSDKSKKKRRGGQPH